MDNFYLWKTVFDTFGRASLLNIPRQNGSLHELCLARLSASSQHLQVPLLQVDNTMVRQHSPYTSRYKKSMSPIPPRNPFQVRRTLSGRNLLPRYTVPSKTHTFMSSTLKQACIILVAGTILVSLLSLAIPPAPVSVNTRMAAPRPQLSQTLRGQGRKRGGVRSQSQVRTINKKLDGRPSQEHHHWDADTLEHDGALEDTVSSEEDSPSKQQLAAEIESKTKKENIAADGVFGRTNDGDENNEQKKKENAVDTRKAVKGHVDIDALDSNDKASHDGETKTDKMKITVQVNDEDSGSDEEENDDDETGGDKHDHSKNEAEKEIERNPVKLEEKELNDQSIEDSSESDGLEEKQDAFGKDEVENNAMKTVVDVENAESVDDKKAANDEETKSSADGAKDDHNPKGKKNIGTLDDAKLKDNEPKDVNADRASESAQDNGKADLDVEAGDNKLDSSKDDAVDKAGKTVDLGARRGGTKKDHPEAREFSPKEKIVDLDKVITERKRIAREEGVDAPSDTSQGRDD